MYDPVLEINVLPCERVNLPGAKSAAVCDHHKRTLAIREVGALDRVLFLIGQSTALLLDRPGKLKRVGGVLRDDVVDDGLLKDLPETHPDLGADAGHVCLGIDDRLQVHRTDVFDPEVVDLGKMELEQILIHGARVYAAVRLVRLEPDAGIVSETHIINKQVLAGSECDLHVGDLLLELRDRVTVQIFTAGTTMFIGSDRHARLVISAGVLAISCHTITSD